MADITASYGSMVFDDRAMRDRIPSVTYRKLSRTIKEGKPLDIEVANAVAHAMKTWALEKGATHYAHWFQPLSGITSEKHDSFLEPCEDGGAITKFSGKELIKGEPDASSFPNGGRRATFEARGYTAWDPTSYAFIKDEVLCIPTAFCSYTGEALDKKTPLLRSMKAIDEQANRVLQYFGFEGYHHVIPTVGSEQEYFLISEKDYEKRQDLMLTGRTLFGAPPCKGQELEEHYFGAIRPTVNDFMKELDDELWKLGVPAKTKHNEVAPCQHELAPVFSECNRAIDQNLLTMEEMRLIASHHGLVCLQHEKPFEGINGSGKHDNWSLSCEGINLLEPGEAPQSNLRFLVFLSAIIAAVDEYQELLRMSIASAGNDHRLGADEAPPAIVSIFLGDDLNELVNAFVSDCKYVAAAKSVMHLGVDVLPDFVKDSTDRNRTSPFAFTGNKFEFRMPGSQVNLADANTILNTAVAHELKKFADHMETIGDKPLGDAVYDYVIASFVEHRRIIFNGNGYSAEWEQEAERRGLANHRTTASALPCFVEQKSLDLFAEFGILTELEVRSRYEVKLDKYIKLMNIEATVMERMARRTYLPVISAYSTKVAKGLTTTLEAMKQIMPDASPRDMMPYEYRELELLVQGVNDIYAAVDDLRDIHAAAASKPTTQEQADCYADEVVPVMERLRSAVDALEPIVARDYWPVPTYNDILFYA